MTLAPDSGRSIELQNRDLQILRGLFDARVMTAEHIAAIHFGGRYEAARKRLQKLKAAGYVGERPRRAYEAGVLFLTRKAFLALIQTGSIADMPRISWKSLEKRVRVSPITLRHELEVQDVRAAFHVAAAQQPHLTVAEFSTWPLLFQFQAFNPVGEAVMVKPDGFIRIHEADAVGAAFEHLFFLEVDRSTEPQETLVSRSHCYRDFYRRGGLAVRRGHPPTDYEQFPFRVLIVFKNAERRNNTAERLLQMRPPILTQVWLTTFAEVTKNPLGPIWVKPGDYSKITAATVFDPLRPSHSSIYRRQPAREELVQKQVAKHCLLPAAPPAS